VPYIIVAALAGVLLRAISAAVRPNEFAPCGLLWPSLSGNRQVADATPGTRNSSGEGAMTVDVKSGYSGIQITLHWLIALLVLFQLVFGESMTTVVDAAEEGTAVSPADHFLATSHYWVGISVLVLVLLRLVVRLASGAPQPAASSGWMSRAATATHWLFYLLLVAVPATGLMALYVNDAFGDIHALGKPVFIVLIALHAAAALFHQFFLKDGTLKRMLVPSR
jgi:cytochrome b561